ncbi:MAG: twin-arginine translocation signal domain-containing protein [Planctomycetaceae bacterium]|jgi:hypothetical protein|nr:twin-arginine translocation signal domain-containing protein [Planctomycetaceae bacterium]
MSQQFNRRDFVKATALGASMASAVGMPSLANTAHANEQKPIAAKQQIPSGTIAGLTIGRMLLGGNLLTHYTHSRDLRYVYNLAAHYNTPEKIFETMRIAEAHGITAVVIHTAKGVVDGMREYKKQGGKIQWIICPTAPINDEMAEYTQMCQQCIDAGVDALYLWGVQSDQLVNQPKLIKKAVSTMKSFDVPVGVAAHKLSVIEVCEQEKIKCDFYLKTFHHHKYPSAKLNYDSSWCEDPDKMIEAMSKVEKPWIAYKIMAAGAIPPRNALEYAFSNGADFTVFGMFDYEIDEDTRLLNEVLALDSVKNRKRKWFG